MTGDSETNPGSENPASGDAHALGLTPGVYAQLKQIARGRLRSYRPGITLDCTALVHEAYLKISAAEPALKGGSQGDHFMAVASMAMRQILVDHARKRQADKRGGGALHVTLQEAQVGSEGPVVDLIALDDALRRLARRDPLLERLVVLRFFAGLSMSQTAEVLGKPLRTTERDWTRARVYLFRDLEPNGA